MAKYGQNWGIETKRKIASICINNTCNSLLVPGTGTP